jgi:predicted RNA binding protein YcfA (HicA-like mRNA interferase family)
MTYRVLTRKLRRLGCEFLRQAPGSHEIWWNPQNRSFTTIPHHGDKDIPTGTLAAILRDLGLTKEELDKV